MKKRQGVSYPTSTHRVLTVLNRKSRQEQGIKDTRLEITKHNYLFIDDTIFCVENFNESMKKHELTNLEKLSNT